LNTFKGYQVTDELLNMAKSDVIFMHCLPAHVGEEVAQEVLGADNSVVFDQAECKLHTAKAVLSAYLS
jgi:ornithine carbamoyltransferase